MSKGSNQRPKAVDEQTFEQEWERIFGTKPNGTISQAFATMPSHGAAEIEWLHEQMSGSAISARQEP